MRSSLLAPLTTGLCSIGSSAQTLLPSVQQDSLLGSERFVARSVQLVASPELSRRFAPLVREQLGLSLDRRARQRLELRLDSSLHFPQGDEEGYRLRITQQAIALEAQQPTGLYRGLQTLVQLREGRGWRSRQITDWPAFRWRGFMMDTGRSYIPLAKLKELVARLAPFKVNVFHWHLTENEAWRIESKRFPQLNAPSSMTRDAGKYYTLAEARELADFCRQRHVLLIPELDMPGHSAAFERVLGYGMQTPEGKATLRELIKELTEALDVPYIHIGTDEVQFTDPHFGPEMTSYIHSLGRKAISWNPGWHYKPGEVDVLQLWSSRGKAQEGIPAVDSRYHYLNHFDYFADIAQLYSCTIYGKPMGDSTLWGAILGIWTDRAPRDTKQVIQENSLYPAMLALAERAWRGGGQGYFTDRHSLCYDPKGAAFQRFREFEQRLLHYKGHFPPEEFPYVQQTQARWLLSAPFPNGGDLSRRFPPEEGLGQTTPPAELPSYSYEGRQYPSQQVAGSGIYLRHVWGDICPGALLDPQPQHTVYATAWVYSEQAQRVGLFFETQNYSRSEQDLAPPQSVWDWRGSRIWVGGRELLPPRWVNEHQQKDKELALQNENASARPLIPLQLPKGWTQICIKLPIDRFTSREVRLVKWMFTAALLTPDGRRAAPVRYLAF